MGGRYDATNIITPAISIITNVSMEHRDYLGNVDSSIKAQNDLERVLGDRNRSGQQFDIWEATFSPMAEDGYPADLWDPETGREIDRFEGAGTEVELARFSPDGRSVVIDSPHTGQGRQLHLIDISEIVG